MPSLIIWTRIEMEEYQSKYFNFRDEFCKGYIDVENFFQDTVEACKLKALELNKIKTEYEQQL